MTALLMMFTSASGQIGGVQEDAIMTVSVLVEGVWCVLPERGCPKDQNYFVIGEELQYRWQCKCMQSKTSCMGSCIAEIAEAGLTVWMGGV